jgi:RNA polymerase sigma-70 factor (ECF subfamily)
VPATLPTLHPTNPAELTPQNHGNTRAFPTPRIAITPGLTDHTLRRTAWAARGAISEGQTSVNQPPNRDATAKRTTLKREASPLLVDLRATATGDHPALARCYDAMGPMVFSLAIRMLRDRAAAEDVTQDIFVQIWRQAVNYDTSRGSPEAWIMMIARTRILDRLRSRAAGIVLKPVGDHLPDSPDAEDWPTDLAITREEAVDVRAALKELPDDQRQAVELAFFDGLTHVEIAQQLATPLGTIKTRIRLGLLKIKDRLHERLAEAATPRVETRTSELDQ